MPDNNSQPLTFLYCFCLSTKCSRGCLSLPGFFFWNFFLPSPHSIIGWNFTFRIGRGGKMWLTNKNTANSYRILLHPKALVKVLSANKANFSQMCEMDSVHVSVASGGESNYLFLLLLRLCPIPRHFWINLGTPSNWMTFFIAKVLCKYTKNR